MTYPSRLDKEGQVSSVVRPYVGHIHDQGEYGVATITLLKSSNLAFESQEFNGVDKYRNNMDAEVTPMLPYVNTDSAINYEQIPSGQIPRVYLSDNDDYEYYGVFNNFSLVQVNESRDQIVKVHNNFGGAWSAFFFGEKPRVFSFAGIFLDSPMYPYYQEFTTAYEKYLSGRKSIENGMTLKLSYDGKMIEGYILGVETSTKSDNQFHKAFNFNVLVRDEKYFRYNYVSSQGRPMERRFNAMSNVSDGHNRLAEAMNVLDLYRNAIYQKPQTK